jgi:predicted transglutaminase-like cysteine proteinase
MRRFVFTIVLSLTGLSAQAENVALAGGALSSTPKGWIQFCEDNPLDCKDYSLPATLLKLDKNAYSRLETINREVNNTIKEVSDLQQYGEEELWTYPKSGKGDCEDIVLEKKRRLVAAGFPKSALLITIVRDLKGEGHAILTLKTDKGDVILDNQVKKPVFWYQTGYQFIKRQSEENPNHWLALGSGTANAVASTGR